MDKKTLAVVGVIAAIILTSLSVAYITGLFAGTQTDNAREAYPDKEKFIGKWKDRSSRTCKFNENGTGYIDGPLVNWYETERVYLNDWKIEKSESGYDNELVITPKYYSESGIFDLRLGYEFEEYRGYTLLDLTFEHHPHSSIGAHTITYCKVE